MRMNFSSETTGHIIFYFYKYDLNPKLDLEYLSLWSGKSHVLSFSMLLSDCMSLTRLVKYI